MSEYICVECETPHDNQEDANLCCACPNCGNLQTQLDELQAENERLKDGMEVLSKEWRELDVGIGAKSAFITSAMQLDNLRLNK